MRLLKSKYKGFNPFETDEWGYYSLRFEPINLFINKKIPNKNGWVNNIFRFADMIMNENKVEKGYWEFIIVNNKGQEIKYKYLAVKSLLEEEIFVDDNVMAHRTKKKMSIFSEKKQSFTEINIPDDKLVIQYLDSFDEYSYLKDIKQWAKSLKEMKATDISDAAIENFESIKLTKDLLQHIQHDCNKLKLNVAEIKLNENSVTIAQTNGNEAVPLTQLSTEMQHTFWILAFVHDLVRRKNEVSTLFIDNTDFQLHEGDTVELFRIILKELIENDIQIILVAENPELLNEVEMEYWSILYLDEDHIARALHYNNSRFKFKELMKQGTSDFDAVFGEV